MTNNNTTEAGPVAPAQEPFQSQININDLTVGEEAASRLTNLILGVLIRAAKERKYMERLSARLANEAGNPFKRYVDLILLYATEAQKLIDADPQIQAALEESERQAFMARMGGGGL